MEPIYKMFTGQHIDLDKIVTISDAKLIEPDGWASSVSFHIIVQLQDNPLSYSYQIEDNDTDKTLSSIQEKIDNLIQVWKEYKKYI